MDQLYEQYVKYLQQVKDWGRQLKDFLHSQPVDEKELTSWDRQLERFDTILNEKLNEASNGIDETIIMDVRNETQRLFNETRGLIETHNVRESSKRRVPIGGHTLPPLPYRYDALEPHIEEEIMRLHHTKHHQSYVDGLNKAEKNLSEARKSGDFSLVKHWERELAFHGSGHYLHTIFWNNMSPSGGGNPSGRLADQINMDFGSVNAFRNHFSEAAKQAEGVGWALLVWSPRSHRLEILQAEKHQLFAQWDVIPLLVLDVWEHAYYLQYKNERGKYVTNWWKVVNWRDVENRFDKARKLKWRPF